MSIRFQSLILKGGETSHKQMGGKSSINYNILINIPISKLFEKSVLHLETSQRNAALSDFTVDTYYFPWKWSIRINGVVVYFLPPSEGWYIYIYISNILYFDRNCTPPQSIGLFFFRSERFLCWMPLVVFFGFTTCALFYDKYTNTRMIVTIDICFNKDFDTKYFAFCNLPECFAPVSEYRIQHGTNGPLYVTSRYSTRIFYRGVLGFANDCPCGVWCRG